MDKSTQIQCVYGLVKSININAKLIVINDQLTNQLYTCKFEGFLPASEFDVITGMIFNQNGSYIFYKKPLIKLSVDKDTVIKTIVRGLGNTISNALSTKIYENILVNGKGLPVNEILNNMAIDLHDKQIENFGVLIDFLLPNQVLKLLRYWYKSRTMRQLYLLGLNNTEIKKIEEMTQLTPTDIYEQCLINPFKIIPISIDKCKQIFESIAKEFSDEDLYYATIVRKIYYNCQDKSWCGTPSKFIQDQFKGIKMEILKRDYGIEGEFHTLYLKHHYKIEKTVSEILANMIKLNKNDKGLIPIFKDLRLTDPQKHAVNIAINKQLTIITGAAGTGKCLHPDTPILMFNGDIKLAKNIITGDLLMGDDNKVRNVLSISNGTDKMYKIIPTFGKGFICNEPHILTLRTTNPRVINYDKGYQVIYITNGNLERIYCQTSKDANSLISDIKSEVFDISVKSYIDKPDIFKKMCALVNSEIEFMEKSLPIDPYILGLYIFTSNINDDKRIKLINNLVRSEEINIKNRISLYQYIPDIYKISNKKNRNEFLSGIIDNFTICYPNDNYIIKSSIILSNENEKIIDTLEYMFLSLGHYVNRINNKIEILTNKTEFTINCRNSNINIKHQKPVYNKLKIEPIGFGKYNGFEIDGNKRFVLGNFLVTHNTTIIKEITQNLEKNGIPYAVSAFTGKAVARNKEVLGNNIPMTLHMMIARHKQISPFKYLIIDEAPMNPTEIMYYIFKCFGTDFQLCLVGDENQLPPISWGNLFTEILNSNTIERLVLPESHRCKVEKSINDINFNSNALISNYKLRKTTNEFVEPMEFRTGNNFFRIEGDICNILELVQLFHDQGVDSSKIIVITPYTKYLDDINRGIQKIYNVNKKTLIDERGVNWSLGDKIMITSNNYNLNLMNGDEGIIVDLNLEIGKCGYKELFIQFKSGQVYKFDVTYDVEDFNVTVDTSGDSYTITNNPTLSLITHSYAITVHKSQGSEYDFVIGYMPKNEKDNSFINFNLIYTWITRPKITFFLVGDLQAFDLASTREAPFRVDNLGKRLNKLVNEYQ